jgi:tetratricopeptide (TPR) repeat protein
MSEAVAPDQLVEEGHTYYQKKEYLAAGEAFRAAAQSYAESGDELNAAEAANNASVAYLQAGEAETAFTAVEGTVEVFARAGDTRRQALALGNRAAALEALDKFEEALEDYEQSADLLKAAGEDELRSKVTHSLSLLQLRTGRQYQALATMQAGLDDLQRPAPHQRLLRRLLEVPFRFFFR